MSPLLAYWLWLPQRFLTGSTAPVCANRFRGWGSRSNAIVSRFTNEQGIQFGSSLLPGLPVWAKAIKASLAAGCG